jgi:hypothetical protein
VDENFGSFVEKCFVSTFSQFTTKYFGSKWESLFKRSIALIHNCQSIADADRTLITLAQEYPPILRLLLEMDGEALDLAMHERMNETRECLDDLNDGSNSFSNKTNQGARKRAKRIVTRIQANEKLLARVEEAVEKSRLSVSLPSTDAELGEIIKQLTKLLHASFKVKISLSQ